jgi:hypothetical protein
MNPQILKVDTLEKALVERNAQAEYQRLLVLGTRWFSASFFISGTINFFLALRIFEKIDPTLPSDQRSQILNEQIAHMTWMSLTIIAVPLVVFTSLFLLWFFRRLSALTGLTVDELTAN